MARAVSPSYFVFEGDGGLNNPARPTLAQVGGAAFVDSTQHPPIPDEQPCAPDYNQINFIAYVAALLLPAATIGVTVTGTTPALNSVIALNRSISTVTVTNPDVSVARQALGQYRVSITSTKLPQITWAPRAHANKAGSAAASASRVSAGVYDVYLSNNTGAIDCSFSLEVSGY